MRLGRAQQRHRRRVPRLRLRRARRRALVERRHGRAHQRRRLEAQRHKLPPRVAHLRRRRRVPRRRQLLREVAHRALHLLAVAQLAQRRHEVPRRLQRHDRVVALPRALHREVGEHGGQAGVAAVAVPAAALPALLDGLERVPRAVRLEPRARRVQIRQHLRRLGVVAAAAAAVLLVEAVQHVDHESRREVEGVALRQRRQQPRLHRRVVQDLRLRLALAERLALAPHARVPDDDGQRRLEHVVRVLHHVRAAQNERAVRGGGARRLRVHALGGHLRVLHQHLLARDAHVVELDPAVVQAVAAHLGAAVADADAGHGRVRLRVAQLHDEAVHALVVAVDDEAREYAAVRRRLPRAADPPLGRGQRRRVDVELLALRDVRRHRLQPAHVAAVAQLGHPKATENGQHEHLRQPLLLLLLRALPRDRAHEEPEVHAVAREPARVQQSRRLEPRAPHVEAAL
mmetsp:Transcript_18052/g.63838  ORF Transcript_18052/g.63838 Transcript_18052/m.63838 type:complete len:458 (+) Transcript_18052:1405-2778(+)